MATIKTSAVLNDAEPAVSQPRVNGWNISWNPDDQRWYVCAADDGIAAATFRERRNAIQYAKKHTNGN